MTALREGDSVFFREPEETLHVSVLRNLLLLPNCGRQCIALSFMKAQHIRRIFVVLFYLGMCKEISIHPIEQRKHSILV